MELNDRRLPYDPSAHRILLAFQYLLILILDRKLHGKVPIGVTRREFMSCPRIDEGQRDLNLVSRLVQPVR